MPSSCESAGTPVIFSTSSVGSRVNSGATSRSSSEFVAVVALGRGPKMLQYAFLTAVGDALFSHASLLVMLQTASQPDAPGVQREVDDNPRRETADIRTPTTTPAGAGVVRRYAE